MIRTRVKICGITRPEDAAIAVQHGVDAIGLVFYAQSPRNVSITQAIQIARHIPAFVTIVALFVNAEPSFIRQVIAQLKPTLLQFHGDETPAECAQYTLPYIKAIRVKHDTNLIQYVNEFNEAKALLLDAFTEGVVGGTGHQFDWNLIPNSLTKPIVLAGGLNADNVAIAIAQKNPFAVDVSGGVESAKGVKCELKIAQFMKQVAMQSEA
jgi:phosphoribosylanthranilate isomerase